MNHFHISVVSNTCVLLRCKLPPFPCGFSYVCTDTIQVLFTFKKFYFSHSDLFEFVFKIDVNRVYDDVIGIRLRRCLKFLDNQAQTFFSVYILDVMSLIRVPVMRSVVIAL